MLIMLLSLSGIIGTGRTHWKREHRVERRSHFETAEATEIYEQ